MAVTLDIGTRRINGDQLAEELRAAGLSLGIPPVIHNPAAGKLVITGVDEAQRAKVTQVVAAHTPTRAQTPVTGPHPHLLDRAIRPG